MQERRIWEVYKACRETDREFLLEIISSKHGVVGQTTVSSVMQRLYDIGIFPDWWKLESAIDQKAWENICNVIETNDSHCRGILLLGLAAPPEDILACFDIAAAFPLVRGFAVGRTIFHQPATQWLKGDIDDAEAIVRLKDNFVELVDGWRRARGLA